MQTKAIVIAIALLIPGCGAANPQAIIADGVAEAANAGLPMLVDEYREQGNRIIDSAKDRATAEAQLADLERDWDRVWKAWESFRVAHSMFVDAIDAGNDTTKMLDIVRGSYCSLVDVWPKSIPATPIAGVSCE